MKKITVGAGRDSFLATATNLRTRETCTGRLTY